MSTEKWKQIIQKEIGILSFCLIVSVGLAIVGRIIGGERNSGQIFIFAVSVFFGIFYFFIQSIRAISWSIINLLRH